MTTYSIATLEVSKRTWDEIADKLHRAGYSHAFSKAGVINMSGIGLTTDTPSVGPWSSNCQVVWTLQQMWLVRWQDSADSKWWLHPTHNTWTKDGAVLYPELCFPSEKDALAAMAAAPQPPTWVSGDLPKE